MIPEKKHKEHEKIVSYNVIAGRIIPKPTCRPDCPAYIEDETYKRLAKYIVDKWPGTTQEDYDYALIEIPRADFEEFQKLAEG